MPHHGVPDGNQAPLHPDSPQEPSSLTTTNIDSRDLVSYEEVQRHNTADDCWLVINGQVYDVTAFLNLHPGGKQVILKMAGQDAT